jgi:hypothetical protein
MNDLIEINGEYFGTGLQLPVVRSSTFKAYADAGPMLTVGQIKDIISDSKRKAGRKRFGPDWIGNQGSMGACNGFAGAYALARARVLRGLPRVSLSGFGLYAQISGGRDNGSGLEEGMRAICENGVPPESLVPKPTYVWSQIPQAAKDTMKHYKAWECYRVETEIELASGLASGFVGVVAVHANNAWSALDSNGIAGTSSSGVGNHAVGVDDVAIIGNEFAFDMFNSWATRWGNQGRCYLTWKRHFITTIKHHFFYLIRSSIDGESSPPEPKD